jgi:hypothetical protein
MQFPRARTGLTGATLVVSGDRPSLLPLMPTTHHRLERREKHASFWLNPDMKLQW